MLMSMTGYTSISEQVHLSSLGSVSVTIELKTLNARFFEVVSKIGTLLGHLEIPITSIFQEKLIRGKIYINIRFDDKTRGVGVVAPAWPVIEQYIQGARSIKEKFKLQDDVSLNTLLRLEDVFVMQETVLTDEDNNILLNLITKAVDMVVTMREAEGKHLSKDFEEIFKRCQQYIIEVEKSFQRAVEHHTKILKQLLAEQKEEEEQDTQIDELQTTLRKIDIHEEITRFKSHLASINSILKSTQIEKGRRLDFIMQELLRETNTMMAKCPAYEVNSTCIDIKVELEKAREQIQNIV